MLDSRLDKLDSQEQGLGEETLNVLRGRGQRSENAMIGSLDPRKLEKKASRRLEEGSSATGSALPDFM